MTVLRGYNQVKDDEVIWRYMDFPKFFSLIETKALFFSPAYRLKEEEPLEFEVPALNAQTMRETISERLFKSGKDSKDIKEYIDRTLSSDDIFHWGVSCWSSNAIESYALWRTFVTAAEGVAIKSCPARLQRAVKSSDREFIKIGKVEYLNHEKDELKKPLFTDEDRLFHKAEFYRDESEFRIITYLDIRNFEFDPATGLPLAKSLENPKYIQSQTIPVSLEELVEEVRVSPYAPPWFKPLVAAYVERAGLSARVLQSAIPRGS